MIKYQKITDILLVIDDRYDIDTLIYRTNRYLKCRYDTSILAIYRRHFRNNYKCVTMHSYSHVSHSVFYLQYQIILYLDYRQYIFKLCV